MKSGRETKQQIWHCLGCPALLLYFVCVNPIIGSFLYMYDSDQQMLLKSEIFTFSPGSAGASQHSLFPPGLPAENDHKSINISQRKVFIAASIVQSVISVIYTDRDSRSLVAVNLGHFHTDKSRFHQFVPGNQDFNLFHCSSNIYNPNL